MSGEKKKSAVQSEKASTSKSSEAFAASAQRQAAKKAVVLGTEKRNWKPIGGLLVCVIMIVAGVLYFVDRPGDQAGVAEIGVTASDNASQIAFPVGLFDDGIARHFRYTSDNITIKYFVMRSSDGIIRAAFDACDVCWRAGRGYYQDGDVMVCRNCGRRFASVLVNEVKGGCNPAPLDRRIEAEQVVIEKADIVAGKGYFNFAGRT